MTKTTANRFAIAAIIVLAVGCSSDDARLTQLAMDGADRQASQNLELAQLNREVAAGTRRLVESDGESRAEFAKAQRELQQQQAEISSQFDRLESERKIAAARNEREPLIAAALTGGMTLLVASLPLVVAWLILRQIGRDRLESVALAELLIEELTSDRPKLVPPSGIATANRRITSCDEGHGATPTG